MNFIKNGPYGSDEENFRHYRSVEVRNVVIYSRMEFYEKAVKLGR